MVVNVGFTVTEPDFLLPVEKLVPVQAVALVELHESRVLPPFAVMMLGVAVNDAVGEAVVVEQSPVVYVIGNPYTYTVLTVHAADATAKKKKNDTLVTATKATTDAKWCVVGFMVGV